jgi:NAD(P)-dependent dehydrogenase (short-subunit alcohol dehydrogenase family)
VTGAASGIGRALAERFAAAGMKLVLADIEEPALAAAAKDLERAGADALPVVTDVAKLEAIEQLCQSTLDRFGAVHLLCNNAGVAGGAGPIWQTTQRDWEWVLGVNLWSVVHGVRVFVPVMLEQGDEGHVVNTASMGGLLSGAGLAGYNVTKHGVVALSECLSNELEAAGARVKVSVVCPGWVQTQIADSGRNRPEALRNPGEAEATPLQERAREGFQALLDAGLPPAEVAEQVFEAVRDERLYVLTHPDWWQRVEARMQRILAESGLAATR